MKTSTPKKSVIIMGWHPDVVDFSQFPDLTAEKLIKALEADRDQLNQLGYDAELLFIPNAESAFSYVSEHLSKKTYDCVLIGAGVRTVPKHLIVFEQLVNAVHQTLPDAKICFNTNPMDTAEAVQRWV